MYKYIINVYWIPVINSYVALVLKEFLNKYHVTSWNLEKVIARSFSNEPFFFIKFYLSFSQFSNLYTYNYVEMLITEL